MQSFEKEANRSALSEQLLMNTEQVGILLAFTLNTTANNTVRRINNENLGMLVAYLCYVLCMYCTYSPYRIFTIQ